MAKLKTLFVCQECGHQSPKWMGRCPQCGTWNSLVEEVQRTHTESKQVRGGRLVGSAPVLLSEVEAREDMRHQLKDQELNRVLGGGLVPGAAILLGGDPGIGKSTLLLQLAIQHASDTILYVCGEESELQIRMRAERLGFRSGSIYLLAETRVEDIAAAIAATNPKWVVVDSVQTLQSAQLDSAPGTVSQIRECASQLIAQCKPAGIPLFLIGHITKEGVLAGPKVLEHMVDCVLQFEGDRNNAYRLVRSLKNRFGNTFELAIYEMTEQGLREVSNPSEMLISPREAELSGVATAMVVEGLRPMLIEAQALVSSAVYGTPQRSATGFDGKRLNMLLAVLEKRCGFKLGASDVFLNITGGLSVKDPAADLAVVSAILSSSADVPVPPLTGFAAEVGLSGELRPVQRMDQRLSEAAKLGLERFFVSSTSKKLPKHKGLEVVPVSRIDEMLRQIFG